MAKTEFNQNNTRLNELILSDHAQLPLIAQVDLAGGADSPNDGVGISVALLTHTATGNRRATLPLLHSCPQCGDCEILHLHRRAPLVQ